MCNKYETTSHSLVEAYFHVSAEGRSWSRGGFPRTPGRFIRRARDVAGYECEVVVEM
jgi:hypothetical protein